MKTKTQPVTGQRLVLDAATAANLMTPNPISVQGDISIRQATTFLVDKSLSAAPVIDEAGKPIGVLSQTDLLIHKREALAAAPAGSDFYAKDEIAGESTDLLSLATESLDLDATCVRDVMTPVVLSVAPTTSAANVIEQLLEQRVHRLFVVDEAGVLIGLVSTVDILKRLRPESEPRPHNSALSHAFGTMDVAIQE
jgi:CBS-domain-containing membrane protein